MNLKSLNKLRKAKKEMLPGVERAIMRLADTLPDLVKALDKMAKSIDGFTEKAPIDNVNRLTPIKGKSYFEDVLLWHRAAKHPVREVIAAAVTDQEQKSRELGITLVKEEFEELMDALQRDHYPDIADGGADLIWVVCGLLIRYGIDLDAMWEEVRRANWDKLGGPVRKDGKLLKPEGWRPPNAFGACGGIRFLQEELK